MEIRRPKPRSSGISVILPAYNEVEIIASLTSELLDILECDSDEIIWVDDGSTDGSRELLVNLCAENDRLHHLHLSQRSGQSAALLSGIVIAKNQYIVLMDGDGQIPPAAIPHCLPLLTGANLVIGLRQRRIDPRSKRLFSLFANWVRRSLTGSTLRDTGCGLRVFRGGDPKIPLLATRGWHRLLPSLVELNGGRVVERIVEHRPRRFGKSKYDNLIRGATCLMDGLALWWLYRRRVSLRQPNKPSKGKRH